VCAPHSCKNEKPFVSIHDDWSNISLNQRGWREPGEYSGFQQFAAKEMDLILVPALAFDETGARLGQGGGWYDRALAGLPTPVLTVGIAFDFQIIDFVPREAHDQSVALIVTDQRAIEIL
jgi:5-formyltetrahydrofolate cyclo-ligase